MKTNENFYPIKWSYAIVETGSLKKSFFKIEFLTL